MPQDDIDRFVREVCAHIRYKTARFGVGAELAAHLNDRREEFLRLGLDEEAATRKAIECMGDPAELGRALDAVHRPGIFSRVRFLLLAYAIPALIVLWSAVTVFNMVKMTPYKLIALDLSDSQQQEAVFSRNVKTAENFHAKSPEMAACLWLGGQSRQNNALLLSCAPSARQPSLTGQLKKKENLYLTLPQGAKFDSGSVLYDVDKVTGTEYTAVAVLEASGPIASDGRYTYYRLNIQKEWNRWTVAGADYLKTSADGCDLPAHDAVLKGEDAKWNVRCSVDRKYQPEFYSQISGVMEGQSVRFQLSYKGNMDDLAGTRTVYLQGLPNPKSDSANAENKQAEVLKMTAKDPARPSGASSSLETGGGSSTDGTVWSRTEFTPVLLGDWINCGVSSYNEMGAQQYAAVHSMSLLIQLDSAAPDTLTLT